MNRLGQIGRQVGNKQAKQPSPVVLEGRYARLEPLNTEKHYRSLYENFNRTEGIFDFLLEPPLTTPEEFRQRCLGKERDPTRIHFVVTLFNKPDDFVGLSCLTNIDTVNRKIEFGRGMYSSKLQKTTASTEVIFLILSYVFDELGFLKVSGKTNMGNKLAIRMLERFGYTLEGTFHSDIIVDGYSWSGCYFAMLDIEWPAVKKGLEEYLHHSNFDEKGRYIKPLTIVKDKIKQA